MRYEERLAALFKTRELDLNHLAMAQCGGFGDRIPSLLAGAPEPEPHFNPQVLRRVFDALLTGEVSRIEAALRHSDVRQLSVGTGVLLTEKDPSNPNWLDGALELVVKPLILIGRADLLPTLHAHSLQHLRPGADSALTVTAAMALAGAGEWQQLLQIFAQARQATKAVDIYRDYESLLWKFAYLDRQVETVMPVLAAMPFLDVFTNPAARRPWTLKTYQIRAGMDIMVPVIEGEQPDGYVDAAAMQIAALSHEPSAAGHVAGLRRALKPKTTELIDADRGFSLSIDLLPYVLLSAEARIAARRKDYAKAAALAQRRERSILIDPPDIAIGALLEEGDWRAAADIAQAHDPRKKQVMPGFDDTRAEDYVRLHRHLALAAARDGDDGTAAAFVTKARDVHQAEIGKTGGTDNAFFWIDTLLAGAAEGRLPRKYLFMLSTPFQLLL